MTACTSLSMFDYVNLGCAISLRSFIRLGCSLSVKLGSAVSVRSFIQLGHSPSVYGMSYLGSSLSALDCANLESALSLPSFMRQGSACLSTACRTWGHCSPRSALDRMARHSIFDGTVQHSMALRDIRQLEQMTLRGIRCHSTRWRGIRWHGVAFEGTSRRSVAQPGGTARHSMALNQMARIRWHGAAFDGASRHSVAQAGLEALDDTAGIRWHST